MATNSPNGIPEAYAKDVGLEDAYRRGWNHGHGLACHNVPTLGTRVWTEADGFITTDAANIRDVHASLCYEAESHSRCYSPFEYTAHEFNGAENDVNGVWNPDLEGRTAELWEAFEAGTNDAIHADLAEYTDTDYNIETADA